MTYCPVTGEVLLLPTAPKALPTAAVFSRGLVKVSCAGDCVTRASREDDEEALRSVKPNSGTYRAGRGPSECSSYQFEASSRCTKTWTGGVSSGCL